MIKKVILQMLLLILFNIGCLAQATSFAKKIQPNIVQPCSLSTVNSPKLRGFYLTQPKEELFNIPFFREEYQKRISNNVTDRGKFGFVMLSSVDIFYRTVGVRSNSIKDFEDVDFMLHFLDGKLMYISIDYSEYEPANLNEFLSQISIKTGLPIYSWRTTNKFDAEMNCLDFTVKARTGRVVGRPEYLNYPSVTLTYNKAEIELQKREKEYNTKLLEAENEKRRLEIEKKKTFKP